MAHASLIHNRFAARLQPERTALVLVDCQEAMADRCCTDAEALRENLLGLVRVARAFDMPIVIGVLDNEDHGGLMSGLAADAYGAQVVERKSRGFWEDATSLAAVRACGRRDLLVAGIDPAEGLARLALAAQGEGYVVRAVGDASAGGSPAAERLGASRMSLAGIEVTSWVAVMAELADAGGRKLDPADTAALNESLERYHVDTVRWGEVRPPRSAGLHSR